jgi:hypothetical protein
MWTKLSKTSNDPGENPKYYVSTCTPRSMRRDSIIRNWGSQNSISWSLNEGFSAKKKVSGTCPIAPNSYPPGCCPNRPQAEKKAVLCHPTPLAQDAPTCPLIFCEFVWCWSDFPTCHVVMLYDVLICRSNTFELFDVDWTLLISLGIMRLPSNSIDFLWVCMDILRFHL